MNKRSYLLSLLVFAVTALPVFAERKLDPSKADKKEVKHSMLGFRNTLILYIFRNQQAVMTVTIDNKTRTKSIARVIFDDERVKTLQEMAGLH